MNKTHRSVWNARKQTYVAAAETVAAKGKPCSGTQVAAVASVVFGGLLSLSAHAQTAPPPNTLPTGGQVSAGQAAISQSGANMVIQQGSERAAINWQSFNVGADAHVQFQQPSAASVTLNRVMSADPSQIFGRISANGQVVLTNPQGVYFGRSARVDVGGLVATTNSISDANFMAGNNRYERNGSTGAVINEGELKAALGGYIALLAPEVRNQGAVIAQMGTVALAAGEAVDLHFDSQNRLTSIRVEPAQIKTLVDNRHAVQAPGGLIILSAQSMDRLLGGVVKNSGRIEANGLQQQGGRILLSASKQVDNSGVIAANAVAGATPAGSGPAGQVSLSAPEVINSGSISASGAAGFAAGSVRVEAERFEQTASASVRAEALTQGGQIRIVASGTAQVAGELSVAAQPVGAAPGASNAPAATPEATALQTATAPSTGGEIEIAAAHITLDSARLDASGDTGGTLRLHASGANTTASSAPATPAAPTAPLPSDPREPGQLAVLGSSSLSTRGRNGRGGLATLTGDDIALQDATSIDASGATGGGAVLVGGDWQGGANAERRVFADPDALYQATTVRMDAGASIDASATVQGDGGTVVLWSDVGNAASVTAAHGVIDAKGGAAGGKGGQIETSGRWLDVNGARVSTLAVNGRTGDWLLDPGNVIIRNDGGSSLPGSSGPSVDTVITGAAIVNALLSNNVTVTTGATGDFSLTVADGFTYNGVAGADRTLTLGASGNLSVNSDIGATGAKLNLILVSEIDRDASSIGQNGRGISLNGPINTNGGNLWVGSGQLLGFWNGHTVGIGAAMGGANNQIGVEGRSTVNTRVVTNVNGVTSFAGGGNIRFQGDSGTGIGVGIASLNGSMTINAGSGNVEFVTNIFDFKYENQTGNIFVNTTGSFTIAPLSTSFNSSVVWNPGFNGGFYSSGTDTPGHITGLAIPNTLSSFTIGKTGNTQNIAVSSALSMPGRIALIGGNIAVNASLTSTAPASGNITLEASTTDVLINSSITSANGNATLSVKAARDIFIDGAISSTTGALGMALDADSDRNGTGYTQVNRNITTNGGSLVFGTGAVATINGVSTQVGGDVYFGGSTALTLSTGGGNFALNGEAIIANTNGVSITTAGGSVLFGGLVNSGNSYTFVSSSANWNDALTAARGATAGGAATGDTYLATITSRLENSIASRATNFVETWLGGRRIVGIGSDASWRWVAGPEASQNVNGLIFFTQNASGGGGTAVGGSYAPFNPGEPNNWNGSSAGALSSELESALQFTGTFGQWNDLPRTSTAPVGYLREANLAPSRLTVAAGAGTVTFEKSVGSQKALGDINITAGSIAVPGGSITTEGSQTYNGNVSLLGADVQLATKGPATSGYDILFNSGITKSGAGDITLTVKSHRDILVNSNIVATGGRLNLQLEADYEDNWSAVTRDGAGFIQINNNVTTNGGAIQLGNDATTNFNGTPVKVGGDLYVAGGSAQTFSTAGGAFTVNGETLIANTGGLTVNTSGGAVTFDGVVNSANAYAFVAKNGTTNDTWDRASTEARSGAGGAINATYLATVTSRLENAIASRAAGYTTAWLGGLRGGNGFIGSSADWYWVTGPEGLANAGRGTVFFNQTGNGTGTAFNGAYINWDATEPNNSGLGTNFTQGTGAGEMTLQITGTKGQWNDLSWTSETPSGYIRETNLAPSALSVNAGNANVVFSGAVGGSKALALLTVTSGVINASAVQAIGAIQINNTGTSLISGVISGATASLSKAGAGTLGLSAANTYTGTTTINAGTLNVTGSLSDNTAVTVASGATYAVGASDTIASLAGAGNVTLGSFTATLSDNTSTTFSGVMSGTGTLVKQGTGTFTLSGPNSYTGATTVNAGTLNVTGSLSDSTAVAVASGATYALGASDTIGSLAGAGSVTLGSFTSTLSNTTPTTFSGVMSGSGALTKQGTGTFILSGANTYTGATSINAGTLNVTGSLSDSTAVAVASGATYAVGANDTIASLAGAGNVTLGSFTSTLSDNTSTTFSGVMSGTGALVKQGTGTFTLSGANTYTGATTISGGSLVIENNAPSFGTSGFSGAGNLVVQSAAASFTSGYTFGTATTGLGGLTIGRTGSTANVTVSAAQSVGGPINIFGGAINVNQNLSTTAVGDVLIRGSGTVTIAATRAVTTNNGNITVTGSRSVNNSGAAALVASGSGKAWQVWSSNADPFNVTTGDVAGGLVFNFKQYGATYGSSTVLGTGSGLFYTLAPTLTATLVGSAVTKVYDGALAATLTAANFSSSGAVDGDLGVMLNNPTSGTYASKDVGTGLAVTASGVTVLSATSSAATGARPVYGYTVTGGTATGNIGTIEAKVLTATATAANKAYDGSTTAVASLTLFGLVDAETLNVTNSASFNSKDVLNANLVTVNSTTLGNGTNGGLASNYSLASGQTVATSITARTVGLSASKTYDGTTDLAGVVTLSGLVAGEALTYTGAVASDKHVATSGKFVSGITLADGTGGLASNYQLPTLNAANASVTIAAATLSPTLINAALSKIYDGTTDAPAGFVPQWSFGGLVVGDSAASLSLSAASFNSATVAGANLLTVSGLAIDAITGSNGSLASDYLLDATSKTATASITRANLVVSADDDARFVTQTDAVGFAGVGYAGWVNGEGSSVLGGALAIARSNAGTNTAGSYVGVLQVSGFTADNYAISYTPGSYTIVGANELLVRVADVTNFYGTATPYSISGASYLASDNTTIVNLLGIVSGSANSFTINDGVGGSASFNLVPVAAQTAGSGALAVGSYQLGQSGAVFVNGANFSNTVRVVGSHQVNAKGLTATAAGLSKIYDGNTSMTGVSLGLAGLETGDTVTVSGLGAFDNRNAGVGKTFSISNLALAGGDAANYFLLSGSGFSGNNASITAKAVTLAPQAVTRVYNGVSAYTSAAADLNHLSGLLGVAGDTVTAATLAFDTKNVGNGKTLTASAVTIADGNGGNNYSVTLGANSTSAITRLNSVTWIGGPTGNWFDPANWAGGAVPDLSNVANVVIPLGVVVSFDTTGAVAPADSGAPVNVDSLGNAGSLTQNSGTLNVGTGGILLASLTQTGGTLGNGGTTVVDSFDQTGGSFSGTGAMTVGLFSQTGGATTLGSDLTVSQGFSQGTSGSVAVGGNGQITDISGGVQLGNLTSSGTLAVNSTDGAITQAAGTAIAALSTSSFTATQGGNPADVTLANAGNDFTGAVSLSGAAVQVTDTNALTLGNVTTTGDLTVNSTGALNLGTTSVGGGLNANSGNGDISQSGPLAVNGSTTLAAGAGDITLSNPANDFGGTVNATGADIALADANALTLGNVTASGNLNATAGTDLALNGTVNAASLDLQATNGSISQGTSNTLTVTNGPTNLGAAGNINLSNPGNDFNGLVNAAGTDISLADANALTLGTVAASGNLSLQSNGNLNMGTTAVGGTLNANSGNGNITQTGSLTVAGLATLQAGSGAVLLNNPGNRLPQGVVVTAASSSITGDAQAGSRAVVEQVIGATPVVPMPGVNVFDRALPPQLVMDLADGAAPAGGATGVTRTGNSAGVIVALADQPGADGVVVVAVSVPKGAAATGFGFALPKSVLDLITTGVAARASLPDGSALPSWLRFDPLTLRLDASAAPAGAMPAEVLLMVGDQQVRVLISERKG